jgi:hypothetical protein
MQTIIHKVIALTLCNILFNFTCFSQINPLFARYTKSKKLLDAPWKIPSAAYVKDNISVLETRPFDGTLFKANWPTTPLTSDPFESIFYDAPINPSTMGYDQLATINWGDKFTDNFVYSWVSVRNPNWFDDTKWNIIRSNLRLLSLQIVASKSKGLFLDTEDYNGVVWKYSNTLYPGKSFVEVSAKVRQRGREFITELQYFKPDIKLLATVLWIQAAWSANRDINQLENSPYALLKAFSDGLLEAANEKALIIDGNEIAYAWTNTVNWHANPNAYELISGSAGFMDVNLINKSKTNFQVGSSCYFENLVRPIYSNAINLKRVEHNVYQSLFNSDEYSWFYSEQDITWSTNPLPPDLDFAIREGKRKIKDGLSLGFTISTESSINPSVLKILSPAQNQEFNIGDVINFQVEPAPSGVNFNYINYYISYERKIIDINTAPYNGSFTATKSGWYHVYAYANFWTQISQQVYFYVKPVICGTANDRISPTISPLEAGISITKK